MLGKDSSGISRDVDGYSFYPFEIHVLFVAFHKHG